MLIWCESKKRWCVLPFMKDCKEGLEPICEILSEDEFNEKVADLANAFVTTFGEKPVIGV